MSKDVFDTSKAKSSGFGTGNKVANTTEKSMKVPKPKKIKFGGKEAKGLADGGHTFSSAGKAMGSAAGTTAEVASNTLMNVAESGGKFIASGVGGTGSMLLEGGGKGITNAGEGVSKIIGSTASGAVTLGRGGVALVGDAAEVTTQKLPGLTRSVAQSLGTIIATPLIVGTEVAHSTRQLIGAITGKPYVRSDVLNGAERTLGGDLKQLGHVIAETGGDVAEKIVKPVVEAAAHNPKTAMIAGAGAVTLGATAYAHAHMQSFANTERTKRKLAPVLNPAEQAKT